MIVEGPHLSRREEKITCSETDRLYLFEYLISSTSADLLSFLRFTFLSFCFEFVCQQLTDRNEFKLHFKVLLFITTVGLFGFFFLICKFVCWRIYIEPGKRKYLSFTDSRASTPTISCCENSQSLKTFENISYSMYVDTFLTRYNLLNLRSL